MEHTYEMRGNCETGGACSFSLRGTNLLYRFLDTIPTLEKARIHICIRKIIPGVPERSNEINYVTSNSTKKNNNSLYNLL